jgi:hypothetical protein
MRMALGAGGLVGLWIVVFIIMYLQAENAQTVITASKPMRETAERLAGQDANGMRVQDSITLSPVASGSRTDALLVQSIVPQGPMADYFGLQVGDKIVQVGPQRIRDISDDELAKDLVFEARARAQQLVVQRNGTEITLPYSNTATSGTGAGAGAGNAPGQSSPANPAPSSGDNRSPLQRQLEGIQKVPTH